MDAKDIHQQIADIARTLHDRSTDDTASVLEDIVKLAVAEIPGAHEASITVVHDSEHIETPASTGPYASTLDRIQVRHRDGPCVAAAVGESVVSIDDIATDERWPAYRRAALEQTPMRSVMSFQMFTLAQTLGALNVYSERPRAFDAEARELGIVYATHAALAWDSARRDDQFHSALASRDVIGQAKGMLMERFGVDAISAFELLRKLSQESNTRLADLARRIVDERFTEPR
jgi:hypothetical protein